MVDPVDLLPGGALDTALLNSTANALAEGINTNAASMDVFFILFSGYLVFLMQTVRGGTDALSGVARWGGRSGARQGVGGASPSVAERILCVEWSVLCVFQMALATRVAVRGGRRIRPWSVNVAGC